MPKPVNGTGRYMAGLDGLRALAVLVVIVYHLNVKWAPGGLLGVGVFFVLSGYLITDLLASQWRMTGRIDMKDFWLRRARRLLPALLVMLASVCAWLAWTAPARLASLQDEIAAGVLYVSNWWLIFHKVSYFESFGPASPFGHLWSLAVEEQFYLFWPLLLAALFRIMPYRGKLVGLTVLGAAASAVAMLLIYEPGTDPSRVYYGTDTRAFGLLIGAALAMVWPSKNFKPGLQGATRTMLDLVGAAALAAIGVMVWKTNEYDSFLYPGGLVLLSLAAAVLVAVLAHPASYLGKLLGSGPFRWLGVRSYGIYLWHYPVIILTQASVQGTDVSIVRAALQLAASIALAALSWRLIEEPIRRGALSRLWKRPGGRQGGRRTPGLRWTPLACALLLLAFLCAGLADRVSDATASSAMAGGGAAKLVPLSPPPAGSADGEGSGAQSAAHAVGAPEGATAAASQAKPPGDSQAGGALQPPPNGQAGSPRSGETAEGGAASGAGGSDAGADPGRSTETTAAVYTNGDSAAGEKNGSDRGGHPPQQNAPDDSAGRGREAAGAEGKKPVPQPGKGITAIGDSVMLDIEPYLEKLLPGIVIDGKIGRQMHEAPDVVEQLKADGKLGDRVVIELGTNGVFSKKQLQSLLDSLGDDTQQIILVNTRVPRKWESEVNDILAETAKDNPKVTLIDWYAASEGKESYFEPDGVHLGAEGSEYYASLVAKALAPRA
ncbi:O-acetyltransferase OatA [Paenibacillus konkukensis]|uniref:O-acetyltransferase OatA n=1 Tax=Paenibacillus konkukensis TaxID=2020716 RepID=A0ABY4RG64_9BACL|nr:acyltransferase family protein [Paenibacillus konkukensis]UQZ81481.1 O-acetyltransferase OatA [Paenibacillus konkukensis]